MDFSAITESQRYKTDVGHQKMPRWLYFFPPAWIVMALWFVVRIPFYAKAQYERIEVLAAFAKANHFRYETVAPTTNATLQPGAALHLPYEVITIDRVVDRMQGTLRGMPFEYIAASVKITSPLPDANKGYGMPVAVTFFRLGVPSRMPRLYVQPKQGFHRGVKLPVTDFQKPWEYTLEGNFPAHYRVIGERDERLDIYTVLSPEVMLQLVEHAFYDIWMHDTEMLLVGYGAGRADYFTQLPVAFATVDMLASEIDRIARALRQAEPLK